jgi:hypothetical protein
MLPQVEAPSPLKTPYGFPRGKIRRPRNYSFGGIWAKQKRFMIGCRANEINKNL